MKLTTRWLSILCVLFSGCASQSVQFSQAVKGTHIKEADRLGQKLGYNACDGLYDAIRHRNVVMMKHFIEDYGSNEPRVNANCGVGNGMSALTYSTWLGFDRGVSFLLEKGATVNRKGTERWQGWTPLDMAVYRGHKRIIEILSTRGGERNASNAEIEARWDKDAEDDAEFAASEARDAERRELMNSMATAAMNANTQQIAELNRKAQQEDAARAQADSQFREQQVQQLRDFDQQQPQLRSGTRSIYPNPKQWSGEGDYPGGIYYKGAEGEPGYYYPTNKYINCITARAAERQLYDHQTEFNIKNGCSESLLVFPLIDNSGRHGASIVMEGVDKRVVTVIYPLTQIKGFITCKKGHGIVDRDLCIVPCENCPRRAGAR